MQDNKTSSLQKHLIDGDITALETALKLEPTIGFTIPIINITAMIGILKKITTISSILAKKVAPLVVMFMIE